MNLNTDVNAFKDLPYYSGLSGIELPIPKYRFPPEHQSSSRLQYYATFFNSIEINSTFYKLPLQKTLNKWSESVGSNFRFTLKFWKQVTHSKELNFDAADAMKFLDITNSMNIKKGCLLIQFPPSLKIGSIDKLQNLLSQTKTYVQDNWRIAVEFRDSSWYHNDVYSIAKRYDAIVVTHDKGRSSSPFPDDDSKAFYIRFHGPSGDYRGSYTDEFLYEYSLYIKEWLANGKTVFVYFNNTMGDAFNNLLSLNKYVLG